MALLAERLVRAQDFGGGLDLDGERCGRVAEAAVGVALGSKPTKPFSGAGKGRERQREQCP